MSKKTLVIYHGQCTDGFGAAFAAYMKFGDRAEYLPWQYSFDNSTISMVDKDVYIFDFSFKPEWLLSPERGAKSITLLDHHIHAKKEWDNVYIPVGNLVVFDMNKSGAVLAWEYLFPDQIIPKLLLYIQDNDLWQFKLESTKPFIKYLNSKPMTFESWMGIMTDSSYREMILKGEAMENQFNSLIDSILENSPPTEVMVRGIKGLAINANYPFASELGHILAKQIGTFGLVYYIRTDLQVKCSVRSLSGGVDVDTLCSTFGGGGHAAAAGMVVSLNTFLEEILC